MFQTNQFPGGGKIGHQPPVLARRCEQDRGTVRQPGALLVIQVHIPRRVGGQKGELGAGFRIGLFTVLAWEHFQIEERGLRDGPDGRGQNQDQQDCRQVCFQWILIPPVGILRCFSSIPPGNGRGPGSPPFRPRSDRADWESRSAKASRSGSEKGLGWAWR